MRYLSALPTAPKGVHSALALPFGSPDSPKGSASRTCVTFRLSRRPQRGCIPHLRYLSSLPTAPKGVHPALALPFTTPSTSKGSAYRACSTFYHSEHLQRERIPRLQYLLLLTAPPKGVHFTLALPFDSPGTPLGHESRLCVTFWLSREPLRERDVCRVKIIQASSHHSHPLAPCDGG